MWIVDSGGPKEAPVQSYSPGCANVHSFKRIRQVAPMYAMTLCREWFRSSWTSRLWTREAEGSTGSTAFARWR